MRCIGGEMRGMESLVRDEEKGSEPSTLAKISSRSGTPGFLSI
jgi:hypothetical protein